MTPPTRFIHAIFLRPLYQTTRLAILTHIELWGSAFGREWESLGLDKKLVWLLFINQTIAVLTLLEFFLLRKH